MKFCPSMNTPYDEEGPCEVCHRDTASCECPECPDCSEHGNPKCAINQWKPDTPIRNINDLAAMIGTSVEGIKKALFKGTDCGIIFNEKDFNTVTVCGYAEGADAECMDHDLVYPFTRKAFWDAVTLADEEGCEMWHEWNDDENLVEVDGQPVDAGDMFDNRKVESDAMDSFGNFPDAGDSASYKR